MGDGEDAEKAQAEPPIIVNASAISANAKTEEEIREEKRGLQLKNARLDDFVVLGKYTLLVCLFSELMILCQLGNMLYMVYAGAAPNVVSCGKTVFTDDQTLKERCSIVESSKNSSSGVCVPELSGQFKSVNLEFNYVCGDSKFVKLVSTSVQMVGVMVGSIVFGNLSDIYGRRKIMFIALIFCLACMIATSFTDTLTWFTTWRFLVCFFNGGTLVILMVFMVENLPKKDRFWISNIITWSPNMIIYAIIAYFSGDWRTLTRASVVLALPCAALLLYLCESPRYLVQSRQLEAARKAILKTYRISGKECDINLLDHVLNKEEQSFLESKARKKYSFAHLFYTLTLTRYTIAVSFSLMVTSILNYSLLFNMEKLSGSIYLNSVYMGTMRYGCNLAIAFSDRKFEWLGRKMVHAIANVLSICALAICTTIYAFGLHVDLANVARYAVLSVISVCSLLYTTNGIASNELFPTCIRNTSFSFGQFFSRIGVVIAPQIFLLVIFLIAFVTAEIWTPLPYFVMCMLAVTDLFLFQFNVTETKGKALVDNMPSKEERLFGRKLQNMELLPKNKESVAESNI